MRSIFKFVGAFLTGTLYGFFVYNETHLFIINALSFLGIMAIYFVVHTIIELIVDIFIIDMSSGTPIDQEKIDRHCGRDKDKYDC